MAVPGDRSYAPSVSGGSSVSFGWGLVPFGGYGYGYGGGLQSYGGGGGFNLGSLLLYGIIAAVAVSALSSFFNNSTDDYGAPCHKLGTQSPFCKVLVHEGITV